MNQRYIILHGHFYQPPRENPWLEFVEVQDSASPFHDWNERITAECYAPNGAARIKTAADRISDIVNNYNHLSFNFGPTLLSWLERANPAAYRRVLEADANSLKRRGRGNAMAQAYSHPILPLCTPRDRRTQIRWGLADFRKRFGREPEGFWLPEAAVDLDTLRDVAAEGIRFVILSPYQATKIREPGGEWLDATGARFDPTRPYKIDLGEDRSIAVFFYDGPIARSFAFGGGLGSADELIRRLETGFDAKRGHDEVLTVAIDGETFGHHRKGADEVLAMALRAINARDDLSLINPAQALELFPPEWEAQIADRSSWSCAHGVERWRSDCGCQANGQPGWKQKWRAPLRESLDELRGHLGEIFEREGGKLLRDVWRAREEYVELVLDPERRGAAAFLERHASHPLSPAESSTALKLLEMQRHALLMFTSCGWFFSELSGLETVQVLKYAARAIQLAREVGGVDLEPIFKDGLSRAPSNLSELGDGARVYDLCVKPSVVSLEAVAAHHAIAGVFEEVAREERTFCYRVTVHGQRKERLGSATLAAGRMELESALTLERLDASFCVLHFGGSDFRCGLRGLSDGAHHAELERALFGRLGQLSLAQVLREIDRIFVGRDYTLRDLFLDERRRLATLLLSDAMRRYESDYQEIFEDNLRLMEFLREIDSPVPTALRVAADVALTERMRALVERLAQGEAELASAHANALSLVQLARRIGARLDLEPSRPAFVRMIQERIAGLDGPGAGDLAFQLVELLDLAQRLGLALDLSGAQNRLWALLDAPERVQLGRDDLMRLGQRLWFDVATLEARYHARRPADGEATQQEQASA